MKISKLFILLLINTLYINLFSQSLIINEVSQGPSGNKEYVELVVNWTPTCVNSKPCVDLRGFIIDDNNGRFSSTTTGVGIASGCIRLSNNTLWSCVPIGTIIVFYNDQDLNSSIPPNDLSLTDGNCRLIIPISNCNLIEKNTTNPSTTSVNYPSTGFSSCGSWTPLGMANSGDSFQVLDANGNLLHAVSWGNNNINSNIYLGNVSMGSKVASFTNTNNNNPNLISNWTITSVSVNETPGLPNNINNENWINSLSFNCGEITPLVVNETITNSTCSCDGIINILTNGSIPPYSYTWSNTSSNISSQNNLCPNTYTLTVTSAIGCTDTKTISVIQSSSSNTSISVGQDQNICQTSTNVTASSLTSGQSGSWSIVSGSATFGSPTNSSTSVTGLSVGINTLKWKVTNQCGFDSAIVNITVNETPIINVSNSINICTGQQLNIPIITSVTTSTLSWQTSNNLNTNGESTSIQNSNIINDIISNNSSSPQLLTYTITANNGSCLGAAQEVTVTVHPLPNINVVSNPTITCTNTIVTVTGSSSTSGVTYTWSPGGTTPNSSSTNVNNPGNYVLTVMDPANGCTNTGTVSVLTNTIAPTVSIGSNPTITCTNTIVTVTGLSSTSGVTYSWLPGGTTPNSSSTNVNNPGNYMLTVTDPANGCTNTGTVTVLTNTIAPTISVGNNPTITCTNTIVTVTGSSSTSSVTFAWSPGGTTPNSSSTNVNTPGNYVLTLTDPANGCTNTGTVTVLTNTIAPTISVGNNPTITCTDTIVTITGSSLTSGVTYSWSPGGTTPNASTTSVNTPGDYVLTITDPLNGCFSTSTVNVTQSSNQPIIIANSNSPICINNTIILSSSTGSNYLWQGPNGFTSSIQNPSITNATTNMSGTYTITITDTTNNCLSTATVNVIVNPLPLVTAFSNSPVCIGGVINLNSTISNANAYSWAGPDNFYSTSINPNINNASVDMAGNYTLTVQSSQGCYNASVVSVSVFSQPVPPQVSPVRLCQFSQANPLTAIQSIGANLNWYGSNQTGGNFSINAPIPNTDSVGIYPYYVSQALQGCESPRIPLIVTILPIPTGTLNVIEPKCAPLCDTIKLSTTSSINFYQWNLGNGNINSNNNSISYCYQNPGNYSISVKITDTSGCINNLLFTNWVNVNENPSADFNITPDDITLFDPQILFINQSTGDNIINYSWNFGDSTTFTTTLPNTIHSYTNPGEYIVTLIIKNNLGCSDTAKVKFEVLDEFNVYIPNTFTPNGDNINEEFYPIGSGFLEDNYLMEIYDRWGELIFTSNKYSIHWKGLRNNDSEAVLQDTYIYKISFQTVMGYSANKTGQIKLIR